MNKKNLVLGLLASIFTASVASATPAIDYSTVTTAVTGEVSPMITAGMAVAGGAALLMVAPKGIRFLKKMWSAIAG